MYDASQAGTAQHRRPQPADIDAVLDFARAPRGSDSAGRRGPLRGDDLPAPSNRTRVSFEVAIHHLGATIPIFSQEIQMGERESVADVSASSTAISTPSSPG